MITDPCLPATRRKVSKHKHVKAHPDSVGKSRPAAKAAQSKPTGKGKGKLSAKHFVAHKLVPICHKPDWNSGGLAVPDQPALFTQPDLDTTVPVIDTVTDVTPGGTDYVPDHITVYDYGTVTVYPGGIVETPHPHPIPEGGLMPLLLVALVAILYFRIKTERL